MRATQNTWWRRVARLPLWMLYPLFFLGVFLSHWTLLRLPYFWDEAGYYIPAAWDFFRTGTLIPVTTASNAHPPLPSILLAAWWHVVGFVPIGTRALVCMVAAAGLLAVYRLARNLLGTPAAIATTLLTALYPVWFAQSTLAHADIFAAAFTLWALSTYLSSTPTDGGTNDGCTDDGGMNDRVPHPSRSDGWDVKSRLAFVSTGLLFSLAALSKETAIVTPVALALWEAVLFLRTRSRLHLKWLAALLAPLLPLVAWYAYHYRRTGVVFGNPEFLRYNATANLDPHRIALSLYHRLLHLTMHMNMFVPVLCTVAILFVSALSGPLGLPRRAARAIAIILLANWLAFSVLGGALLTRYLLPAYPLILLVCVAEWQRRLPARQWAGLATFSAVAFLAGIWINPPYAFAPEDNLTYRDMVVLHQRAIGLIATQYPQATVLTAWPASTELERPELGYTRIPIKAVALENFAMVQIQKAAADPGAYDTALLFSTKWAPSPGQLDVAQRNRAADTRYFDFHEDVSAAEAAAILHGELIWQAHIRGEWVAVLRFPRVENAAVGGGSR